MEPIARGFGHSWWAPYEQPADVWCRLLMNIMWQIINCVFFFRPAKNHRTNLDPPSAVEDNARRWPYGDARTWLGRTLPQWVILGADRRYRECVRFPWSFQCDDVQILLIHIYMETHRLFNNKIKKSRKIYYKQTGSASRHGTNISSILESGIESKRLRTVSDPIYGKRIQAPKYRLVVPP